MHLTESLRRNALVSADSTSTICSGRIRSWSQTLNRVSRFASSLRALGADGETSIGILSLNSDRYFESFFAIPWAGSRLVPMNIRWAIPEHVFSINDSNCSILLVDDMFADMARQIKSQCSQVKELIYIGENVCPDDMLCYESLIDGNTPCDVLDDDPFRVAGVFYTGGTTGFPKGVMLSHKNLWSSSISVMAGLRFNDPGTVYLHAAPMFHLADAGMSLANTIAGSTHAFIPAFDPALFVNAVSEYNVTDVLLVPTMISMLMESPAFEPSKLCSLRKFVYGASPMPHSTLVKVIELLPDLSLYNAYGQTELAPLGTILGPEYHVTSGPLSNKLRSVGKPGFCVSLKIVDDSFNELPRNEVGQVAVKGPNTMIGYLNQPEMTSETIIDGWVLTGDAGYLDDDGFLFLVDRVKDMIISGGENVFSVEVEYALSKHPSVNEVVVIGIPDKKWGESVHAIVRLKEGLQAEESELIEHCKLNIAGYKCPRSVEFRVDPFPITGAGKIRKVDIRKPYWDGFDRSIN